MTVASCIRNAIAKLSNEDIDVLTRLTERYLTLGATKEEASELAFTEVFSAARQERVDLIGEIASKGGALPIGTAAHLSPKWSLSSEGELPKKERDSLEKQYGLPLRDDGRVELTHWSSQQDLDFIDPTYHGKGRAGAERTRKMNDPKNWVDRSYYGIAVGKPGGYVKESGLGSYRYTTSVDPRDLYNLSKDPEGFLKQAKQDNWSNPQSLQERLIREAGYKGYWTDHPSMGKVAAVFTDLPVEGDVTRGGESVRLSPMDALNPWEVSVEELYEHPAVEQAVQDMMSREVVDPTHPARRGRQVEIIEEIYERETTRHPIRREKKVWLVMGPPASGKSSVVESVDGKVGLAEREGAVILDSDHAKEMIEEFDGGIGANAVHNESKLISGEIGKHVKSQGFNIVEPIVGGDYNKILKKLEMYEQLGYTTSVWMVDLDISETFRRSIARYKATGRMIPPDYIFFDVGYRPAENYLRLMKEGVIRDNQVFDSAVPRGDNPKKVQDPETHLSGRSIPAGIARSRGRLLSRGDQANQAGAEEERQNLKFSVRTKPDPKKTVKAYKLLQLKKTKPGQTFPLFIGRHIPTTFHKWLDAEFIPTKGYAERPGWHFGYLPVAPHLMKKNGLMPKDRVWVEVEIGDDRPWQEEAERQGGDIKGEIPEDGFYTYPRPMSQGGQWMIAGTMKVNRPLSDNKVSEILNENGIEAPEREGGPLDLTQYGFDEQGNVLPNVVKFSNPDVYYSELENQINAINSKQQPANNWKNQIKKMTDKGVKQEELDWSGVLEWLDGQGMNKVTKAELQEYLASQRVHIDEAAKYDGEGQISADNLDDFIDAVSNPENWEGHNDGREVYIGLSADQVPFELHQSESYRSRVKIYNTETGEYEQGGLDIGGIGDLEVDAYRALEIVADLAGNEFIGPEGLDPTGTKYAGAPKFRKWSIPGENYTELLLTLPPNLNNATDAQIAAAKNNGWVPDGMPDDGAPPLTYQSGHWDEANVVAHVRHSEQTTADGKRVLLIDEIQSDWHQAGHNKRKKEVNRLVKTGLSKEEASKQVPVDFGYSKPIIEKGYAITVNGNVAIDGYLSRENAQEDLDKFRDHYENTGVIPKGAEVKIIEQTFNEGMSDGVPNAPFKKTETWAMLAFKRMLRHAAENGFDQIVWTPGEVQADRYDLSKQVDEIRGRKEVDGTYSVSAVQSRGDGLGDILFNEENVSIERVEELVGKDLAKKIEAQDKIEEAYSGGDLKVGGEGMIGFYDKLLPKAVNKYLKKWGVKVGVDKIDTTPDTQKSERYTYATQGSDFYVIDPYGSIESKHATKQEALNALEVLNNELHPKIQQEVWSIPVTEEMKASVMGGQPLFSLPPGEQWFEPEPSFETPLEMSLKDRFLTAIVDKFHSLTKTTKAIGDITESEDVDNAVVRYPGMARARIDDFELQHQDELIKMIDESNLTFEQAAEFLHARHAREANAVLKRRNPDREDNEALSGMTNERADELLAQYEGNNKAQAIGMKIDQMNRERLQEMVDDELLTPQEAQAWAKNYAHYVPLHREDISEDSLPRRGRGFDIRGKESIFRAGSRRDVDYKNMFAHILAQHETAIVRAEKNKVAQSMYNLAKNHPNPDMWETDTSKMATKPYPKADGTVGRRPDYQNSQNVIAAKFNGEEVFVEFNTANKHAKQIVSAIKNLNSAEASAITRGLLNVNRFLSTINTSLSPEFVISNFFRDAQTAFYNLTDTEVKDLEDKIIRSIPKAMKGIHSGLRGDGNHEWAAHFDEFRRAGGMTGWMQAYDDITDRMKSIERALKYGNKMGFRHVKGIGKFISDYNTIVENAVRLATFKNAREAGLSEAKAAKIAKEVTVNFNRKGEWSMVANALYLFYNASVQGSARLLRAVANKDNHRLHKMVAGTIAVAALLDIMNRMISDDDEEEGKSKYDLIRDRYGERNLILMDPLGVTDDGYLKLPLPWGYNVFHVLGQEIGAAISHSMGDLPDWNAMHSTGRVLGSTLEAFNPVQDGSILQTLSPTVVDPLVRIAENVDWHGGPLYPNYNQKADNYTKFYSTARESSRSIAQWLAEATRTDDSTPIIDVSPEWIDMGIDFITGSAGRVAMDTYEMTGKLFKGEAWEYKEFPMLRKVYGQIQDSDIKMDFYNKYYSIIDLDSRVQTQIRDGYPEKAKAMSESAGERVKLIPLAKNTQKKLRKLKKQINLAKKAGKIDVVSKLEKNQLRIMNQYLKVYWKVMYND